MTNDEWESCALIIENCWRGSLDDKASAAYYTMLKRFDADEVMFALHALVENGRPFLPAVPEIVAEIRSGQEPPVPAWSEVWPRLRKALWKPTEAKAVAYVEELHPMVVAFLKAEGWQRLREAPLNDPDYGTLRLRDLEQRWSEFVDVAAARRRQGHALHATGAREVEPGVGNGLAERHRRELGAG